MTEQDQIKALAELDGLSPFEHDDGLWSMVRKDGTEKGSHCGLTLEHCWAVCTPKYLHSYDAILPLVQKQQENIKQQMSCMILGDHIWGIDATPAQLCKALLRATGKWTE